ncbi:MAG TPA: metallophosphoesterase [Myxococcales bacterium]|nr:metallophosphoesterase [Myxococcales bacterium]
MRRLLFLMMLAAACAGPDLPATAPQQPPPQPPTLACQSDDDCDPGDFCVAGQCVGNSGGDQADAGSAPDAGVDAGAAADAGTDAGTGTDAGAGADAGAADAGEPDAGAADAGPGDAGVILPGHLTLSPSSATAQTTAGVQLAAQSFTLGNDGDAALSWSASCDAGTPSPSSGTLAAGGSIGVQLTPPLWTAAGTQAIHCTASAGDAGSAGWTLTVTISPAVTGVGATGGTVDLLDFVFTGDTRPTSCYDVASPPPYPAAAFQGIVAQMGKLSPQFALDLGDHQYTCSETLTAARAQLGFYTTAIANAGFKPFWFMTMGNHECGAGSTADCSAHPTDANYTAYQEALATLSRQSLPYYKVDVQTRFGLARLVFIADNWYDSTAQGWVENTLADADAHAKYTIILKHHPIAETIGSLRTGPTWSYDLITSGRHKYTLVLTAHAHDYDHPTADYGGRSLICGLGAANTSSTGFCRVQQQADQTMKVTAYDAYGNVRTDPSSTFVVAPQ